MKTAGEVISQGQSPWYLHGGNEQNNREKPDRVKSLWVNI